MIYKCRNINCKREFDKASHRNQHEKDAHKNSQGTAMNNRESTQRAFEAWWDGRDLPENIKAAFFMAWQAALASHAQQDHIPDATKMVQSQAQQTESRWTLLENFTFIDGQSIYIFDSCHPEMGVLEAVYNYRSDCMLSHRVETTSGSIFGTGNFTHFMVRNPAPLPPAPEGDKS